MRVTRNLKKSTASIAALCAVLSPAAATAQSTGPRTQFGAESFHENHSATATSLTTSRGFSVVVVEAHEHVGEKLFNDAIRVSVSSPWGEHFEAYFVDHRSFKRIRIVGVGEYKFYPGPEAGPLTTPMDFVSIETAQGVRGEHVGNRVERVTHGLETIDNIDLYQDMALEIHKSFSPEFLEGLRELSRPSLVPAGCSLEILECSLAVIGWIGSVAAFGPACVYGLTLGCIAAILVHEAANGSVIIACGKAGACLQAEQEEAQHPRTNPDCG